MSNDDDVYDLTPMVVIRQHFLNSTDGNVCAASMLDRFNAKIATELERSWYNEKYNQKKFDYTVEYSIKSLARWQCDLFSENEIAKGLNILIDKGYINIVGKDGTFFRIKVNRDKIHRELHPTLYQHDDAEKSLLNPIEEAQNEDIQDDVPSSQKQSIPLKRNENRRVDYHNNRASRVGLSATLTVEQWTKTLEHFNWHCAFCAIGHYDVMEHFIPIIHGGGTTEYNCVPACAQCNRAKHDNHPSMIPSSSPVFALLQSVQEYLDARRTEYPS